MFKPDKDSATGIEEELAADDGWFEGLKKFLHQEKVRIRDRNKSELRFASCKYSSILFSYVSLFFQKCSWSFAPFLLASRFLTSNLSSEFCTTSRMCGSIFRKKSGFF